MNNTVLTNTKLGVNPDAHEQHRPNQKTTGVNQVLMNNTDLTKRQLVVNPDVNE